MQILSCLDAISPAFARTRLVLFTPFRFGRTWKLCATAYLSVGGTIFLPFPLIYLAFLPVVRRVGMPYLVPGVITAAIVMTLLYLAVFYLVSRLRFASFDIVLNRGQFVAPAWRRYGPASFKWTLFKVLLGCVAAALIAAPTITCARRLVAAISALNLAPGQQPPPELLAAIFSAYAGFFLLYAFLGIYWWLSSLLSDFIVPSLALENTTLKEAFRRLGLLIKHETGQFLGYAFLKVGLAIAAYMALTIGSYIVILVVAIAVVLVALIGYLILHALGVSTAVMLALGVILGVLTYLFFVFYVAFFAIGTAVTFLESWTLYFLGGRYALLGQLLTASTPPSAVSSPPDYTVYSAPPHTL